MLGDQLEMDKSMDCSAEHGANINEHLERIAETVDGNRGEDVHVQATWAFLFAFTTRSHLPVLCIGLLLSIASGIIIPAFSVFLGKVFNAFTDFGAGKLDGPALVQRVSRFALYLIGLGGISWILNGGFLMAWLVFGELQARNVRDQLFDGMLKKDMAWYEMRKAGVSALIPRLQTQIRELQSATSQPLGFATQYGVTVVAAIALAFYTAWSVTLVTLATVPLIMLILSRIAARLPPSVTQQLEHLTEASKHASNAIISIDTVKYYNGQEFEVQKYKDAIKKAAKYYLIQARANAIQIGFVRLAILTMFVQGFWYGSHLVQTGKKNPGQVLTAFWACLMATQTIEQILPQVIVLEKGKAAATTLKTVLAKIEKGRKVLRMTGAYRPRFCDGDIRVRNVFFAYPSRPEEFVLKHTTMSFPAGETTFIVGKSGSGKSTLGNLLLRFYDAQSGDIVIDGAVIQTLDTAWLRNNITLVQQSSILFHETIFKNIAFGKRNYQTVRLEEVKRCLDMAALKETIAELPRGVYTTVGSGGSAMSGGQKQRVAIARARLRNTPVLILDEATSALDHITRTLVMDAIRKWRKGKTTIIITHDISQILKDDYVYVLEGGCLVQEGFRYALEPILDGPFATFVRPNIAFPILTRPSSGFSRSPTRLTRSSTVPTSSSTLFTRSSTATTTAVNPSAYTFSSASRTLSSKRSDDSLDSLDIQITTPSHKRISQLSLMALPRQMNTLRNSFRNSKSINRVSLNRLSWQLPGQSSEALCSPLSPSDEFFKERRDALSALPRRQQTFRMPGRGSEVNGSAFSPVMAHMQRMSNARLSMIPLQSPTFLISSPSPTSLSSPIELDIMDYPLLPDRSSSSPRKVRRHTRQQSSISRISVDIRDSVLGALPRRKKRPVTHASEARELSSLKEVFATIWPRLTWKKRLTLSFGFGSAFVHAASTPVFSWVFSKLLETLYARSGSEDALRWSLAILGVAVTDAIASYFMHYLLEDCGQAWVDALRIDAVERILDQPRLWFDRDKNNTSALVDCLDRNAEEMRNLLGRFACFVFVAATMTTIAITWSLIASWKLTLVALSSAPFVYGVTRGFEGVSGKWEGKSNGAGEAAASIFAETFVNIRTVRALTLEAYFHRKHANATKAALGVGMTRAAYSGLFFGISDAVVIFVTALMFYYGSILASSHQFTVSTITFVFTELLFSIANANAVVAFVPQINSSRDTASRLLRLSLLPYKTSYEHVGQEQTKSALPISISHLTFAYSSRPTAQVLQNFSLKVRAGTFTCLVGSSGSGKSTIASLLLGLYQCPNAALDENRSAITIASKDIRTLHLFTLRKLLGIIPQAPTLFPASVADNITYGIDPSSPLVSDSGLIQRAARMAGIHEFITSLPHGYETQLGDGGLGMSGGQAQRIGIARALVRKPQVLILDEPTSALDAGNAESIRRMLRELVEKDGVAVLCVTHDPEMMKAADRVVVLAQGKMVEEGKWESLIGKEGGYLRELMGHGGGLERVGEEWEEADA